MKVCLENVFLWSQTGASQRIIWQRLESFWVGPAGTLMGNTVRSENKQPSDARGPGLVLRCCVTRLPRRTMNPRERSSVLIWRRPCWVSSPEKAGIGARVGLTSPTDPRSCWNLWKCEEPEPDHSPQGQPTSGLGKSSSNSTGRFSSLELVDWFRVKDSRRG